MPKKRKLSELELDDKNEKTQKKAKPSSDDDQSNLLSAVNPSLPKSVVRSLIKQKIESAKELDDITRNLEKLFADLQTKLNCSDAKFLSRLEYALFGTVSFGLNKTNGILYALIKNHKWEVIEKIVQFWTDVMERMDIYEKFPKLKNPANIYLRIAKAVFESTLPLKTLSEFLNNLPFNINEYPRYLHPGAKVSEKPKAQDSLLFTLFKHNPKLDKSFQDKLEWLIASGLKLTLKDFESLIKRSVLNRRDDKLLGIDQSAEHRQAFLRLLKLPTSQKLQSKIMDLVIAYSMNSALLSLLENEGFLKDSDKVGLAIRHAELGNLKEYQQACEILEKEKKDYLEDERFKNGDILWQQFELQRSFDLGIAGLGLEMILFILNKQPVLIEYLREDFSGEFISLLTVISARGKFFDYLPQIIAKIYEKRQDCFSEFNMEYLLARPLCPGIVILLQVMYQLKMFDMPTLLKDFFGNIFKPSSVTIRPDTPIVSESFNYRMSGAKQMIEYFAQQGILASDIVKHYFDFLSRAVLLKNYRHHEKYSNLVSVSMQVMEATLKTIPKDSQYTSILSKILTEWGANFKSYDCFKPVVEMIVRLMTENKESLKQHNADLLFVFTMSLPERCKLYNQNHPNQNQQPAQNLVVNPLILDSKNPVQSELDALKFLLSLGLDLNHKIDLPENRQRNLFEYISECNILQNNLFAIYERFFLESTEYADRMRDARDVINKEMIARGEFRTKNIYEDRQSVHLAAVHLSVSKCASALADKYLKAAGILFSEEDKKLAAADRAEKDRKRAAIHKQYFDDTTDYLIQKVLEKIKKNGITHFLRLEANADKTVTAGMQQYFDDALDFLKFSLADPKFVSRLSGKESYWNDDAFVALRWLLLVYPRVLNTIDQISKLSIAHAFMSINMAIKDSEIYKEETDKSNVLSSFVTAMRNIQREYNKPKESPFSKDATSCPSGTFNILISCLDQIHPLVNIRQVSNEHIFEYIRDFYQDTFLKLSTEKKNAIYRQAIEEEYLPKSFIDEYKASFLEPLRQDIEAGYLTKSKIEEYLSMPLGLDYFEKILKYQPVILQDTKSEKEADGDIIMQDAQSKSPTSFIEFSGNDPQNGVAAMDTDEDERDTKLEKEGKSGKDEKASQEVSRLSLSPTPMEKEKPKEPVAMLLQFNRIGMQPAAAEDVSDMEVQKTNMKPSSSSSSSSSSNRGASDPKSSLP